MKYLIASIIVLILLITTCYAGLQVDKVLYVEGSIYNAYVTIGNTSSQTIIAGTTTIDPCGTLGKNAIFFNSTQGKPCFCNSLGIDLSLYDGTSSCF